ncbi:MAG: substrate-binding domain-containing protein, partial [Muribaculaceae bacterium]|nr:substrate-binding domain-containing protein [Muribaculaceae bacterium]
MLFTLCLILSIFLLDGCGSKGKEKKYRIGVTQCSDDDWRKKMNEEIEREVMMHPEIEVEIRSADDRNDKQIEDIRYFIDKGVDILLVAPNEADALTPVIKEEYDSGIPVLIIDRSIHG